MFKPGPIILSEDMKNSGGHAVGTLLTESSSRIGWGRGNSPKKRMLGRQIEVGCLKIPFFIDKNTQLSPKEN